ncbi:hypothetical protein E1J38_012870 [Seonamhaeicola sediminis]|uniref:DUF1735 domain-containing protein n=1 Tax=Seonamhaeicola sediminis TaxID=2528206 RepID=A0A562YC45_9FLAO|nr:hypothetical protein [Seonamhaeicola sediminis]TWO31648.1 hypothetical protein E1J38_012870 [Seonamhaeicola sediminis]
MKNLKYIIACLVLSVISFSCTDQSTFRNPSHFELENGAYIRFKTIPPTSFIPEDAASVSIAAEMFDPNDNVIQYDLSMIATIISTGQVYKVDDFITITDFPATLNITSQMISDAIGVPTSEFGAGDLIQFKAVTTRDDGVKFYGIPPTFNDDNGTVGIGNTENNLLTAVAYKDAMDFEYVIACPLDDTNTLYTGKYELTTTIPGVFGPIFNDQEIELEAISVYQRTFEAIYLEPFGFGNTATYTINFICGEVTLAPDQGTGLGCSGSLILTSSTMPGGYSETDDSELIVNLIEDSAGCGGGDTETAIVLKKI